MKKPKPVKEAFFICRSVTLEEWLALPTLARCSIDAMTDASRPLPRKKRKAKKP